MGGCKKTLPIHTILLYYISKNLGRAGKGDIMPNFMTSHSQRKSGHKAILLSVLSCLSLGFVISAPTVFAQETSLNAPEVLDLDDPFSRGINRAADQASDGLSLPEPNGQTMGAAKVGKDLLGESQQRAVGISLYRVAALAVTEGSGRGQIFEASNQDVIEGSRPQIPYLRIGSFDNEAQARQTAINLKAGIGSYIGGHFILRETAAGLDLDLGPMHSVSHADNYCEMLMRFSNGIISDCYTVLEYPGYEPLDTFLSTAMLRLSNEAVANVLTNDEVFDLTKSAKKLIKVKEGDRLGNGVDQIVKITPSAVILVSDDGTISQLPLDYIEEREFQIQAPAEEQANANLGLGQ